MPFGIKHSQSLRKFTFLISKKEDYGLLSTCEQKKDVEASSLNVAKTGLERVAESACAPKRSGYEPEVPLTSVKQKEDAEASSFNVAGTGLEPVSESACAPWRSGYEP